MVDFNEFNVDELAEMKEKIASVIKAKKAEAAVAKKTELVARDLRMRADVKEGDKVSFLFNKIATNGKIVRVSEKTVTVEFVKDGETVKKYRKFSEILEILA